MYTDFMKKGRTINADAYCATLTSLRNVRKNKTRGKISKGIVLLHTVHTPKDLLQRFRWEVWKHPSYSPDLAPCDYHIFGKPIDHMGGKRFSNDEEVKTAVLKWHHGQEADFYRHGIERLVKCSGCCLKRHGDYV